MANQTRTFEGPFAATESAEFATQYDAEVEHEGVVFSVTYNDAATPKAAADADSGNDPAAAAIAAARKKV